MKRAILPASVFMAIFGLHYLWLGLFPEWPGSPNGCALRPDVSGWWQRYIQNQSYFLGFSYALSLAFAAWALRRYKEEKMCGSRTLAIGGVTFPGVLAIVGCYASGCCGSPMLVVYLNMLGVAFLPLAKPLVALITLAWVTVSYFWLIGRSRRSAC